MFVGFSLHKQPCQYIDANKRREKKEAVDESNSKNYNSTCNSKGGRHQEAGTGMGRTHTPRRLCMRVFANNVLVQYAYLKRYGEKKRKRKEV